MLEGLDGGLSMMSGAAVFRSCAEILTDTVRYDLIEGLVHSSATIITGVPEAGKSTIAAAMASAVAQGRQEFLGRAVRGSGPVMVACTDLGEDRAWAERVGAAGTGLEDVRVANFRPGLAWERLVAEVESIHPALFVFDNVLGATEGDIRGNDHARRLLDPLNSVADMGVPVLLVHHDGRMGNAVMGSTAYQAWARIIVSVTKSGPCTRLLKISGNDGAATKMSIDIAFGEGRSVNLSVNSDEKAVDRRHRKAETHADRRELGQRIVDNPKLAAMTQRQLAESLGIPQANISRSLSEVGAKKTKESGIWVQ